MPLLVEIVTLERLLVSREADMAVLPGSAGQMGVMAGHVPLLTTLAEGEIVLVHNGEDVETLAVSGGLAEVRPDKVTVLADTAERGEEIDIQRAEEARQRAEERLREESQGPAPSPVHLAALRRSQARLRVAERMRRRRARSSGN